ncbi:hypothetical protein BSR29_07750 [Boudabousia liubingyangii]|uniref:ABC transporter domain-containing protein n=1 Tax=Boudabousia liubingyangii TaxID=1921764 RepID=A0A1Q5PJQ4_9ACTO|nr:ABC transporter ATP-binding protein [Boudabousia liubingyangii]OKL46139.1 hypothetical protein BSR29_07750 [Boudabousia liubingyangii]
MEIKPAAVSARGWGWRHASRRNFTLSGLDLEVQPGQRVLLLGPSGAGKSTFLHALAGVLAADEGEQAGQLLIDGQAPADQRGRVGMVLQDPNSQVIVGKVGDDVAFGPESLQVPRPEIWQRVYEALDAVGLDVPLTRPTNALSGGQKQRMALAGALAMAPGLLLLDEPTANLDPEGILEVRDAVIRAQARTGATLIVVEHRVPIWAEHVDRIVVLEKGGGVRVDGPPAQVLADHGAELAEQGVWVADFERPEPLPKVSVTDRAVFKAVSKQLSTEEAGETSEPGDTQHAPSVDLEPVIWADDLTIGYSPEHPVGQHLQCAIPRGVSTCITGVNGAGKSTLALTLAGLLPALSGTVHASEDLRTPLPDEPVVKKHFWRRQAPKGLLGADGLLPVDPHDWSSKQLLPRMGTVFQSPEHQFVTSTVVGELMAGPQALGIPEAQAQEQAMEVLTRLRLDKLAKANPFTLSGGEKRRLSVATVLVSAPQVIFLDEPTFGQDLRTWRELIRLLKSLIEQGMTLVSVTHDEDYLAALGQHILHVDESGVSVK